MLKIYHNPRCSKSRAALKLLEDAKLNFDIANYVEQPLNAQEIADILQKLGLSAKDVIRKGEAVFKQLGLGLNDDESILIKAIAEHPILLERPILTDDVSACIGRPTENIAAFIKNHI